MRFLRMLWKKTVLEKKIAVVQGEMIVTAKDIFD